VPKKKWPERELPEGPLEAKQKKRILKTGGGKKGLTSLNGERGPTISGCQWGDKQNDPVSKMQEKKKKEQNKETSASKEKRRGKTQVRKKTFSV